MTATIKKQRRALVKRKKAEVDPAIFTNSDITATANQADRFVAKQTAACKAQSCL